MTPSLPHGQLTVPPPLLYNPFETIDPPFLPPENYVILQNPPHPTPPTLLPSSQTNARPSERRKAPTKKMQIPTSVPVYTEPATFLRSFGCCMWSELLSWHKTVSFTAGSTFIDLHLSSMTHRFLQWESIRLPTKSVIFAITWPTNSCPPICSKNFTRLISTKRDRKMLAFIYYCNSHTFQHKSISI